MAQLGMPFGCVYTTAPMGRVLQLGMPLDVYTQQRQWVECWLSAVYTRVLVECLHSEALRMHLEISTSARMTGERIF